MDQLYAQADALKVQIQQTEANTEMAKQEIQELHLPLQLNAKTMQQLATKAETQINMVFGTVPVHIGEAAVIGIVAEIDALLQGWQQAVMTFNELKASAFSKVPELGPLFWKQTESAQQEQGTGSGGEMEIETVTCN